jgi:hypothetical protein
MAIHLPGLTGPAVRCHVYYRLLYSYCVDCGSIEGEAIVAHGRVASSSQESADTFLVENSYMHRGNI